MTDTSNVTPMFGAPSKPFRRGVEITLSPSERTSYGESLARKKIERDHLVAAAKEEARKRKNVIADVSAEVDRLAAAVDTGKEFREVDVYWRLEGPHKVVRMLDGDVEVDRGPASAADQQIDLPYPDDEGGELGGDPPTVNVATSWTGDTVATMPDDDEEPAESPTPPAKAKKLRAKKGGTP